ncbi:ASCH domain-containing protein [Trinickia mobilis]|uniref:ASCH domain-containing protein n=1 Tax=Trinickia mobilis TaxID=2816356 RepID=UPI001A8D94BA|nr:ASCH domain-containing protein [Trinickia mobilis]
MSLFQESSPRPGGRAVLLSIKPKYADLILAGSKRVEFRRSWAAQDVSVIVLYSSSPIQKIVGVVEVAEIVVASPTILWKTCTERGGGLTREELRSYFADKSQGVAVLLGKVFKLAKHVDPSDVVSNFVPPQSFRYLDANEYRKLAKKMATSKDRQ